MYSVYTVNALHCTVYTVLGTQYTVPSTMHVNVQLFTGISELRQVSRYDGQLEFRDTSPPWSRFHF